MVKQKERSRNGLADMVPEKTADPKDRTRSVPAIKPEVEEPLGETPDSVELYLNEIARYKLLRPDEEVSLAKQIESGRILDELSDAFMEEQLTVPTMEQLTVSLLKELVEAAGLVRRSKALKGFPQRGALVDQLNFEPLRDVIQDRMDEEFEAQVVASTKRNPAQVRTLLITLAVAQRIFPESAHKALEEALQLVKERHDAYRPTARSPRG